MFISNAIIEINAEINLCVQYTHKMFNLTLSQKQYCEKKCLFVQ